MFSVPDDLVMCVSDFSQIEIRLQAEFSRDPVMHEVYRKGEDIYCTMATFLYGRKITKKDEAERFVGKTVMLALGYGMGPTKLGLYAQNAGINKTHDFWQHAWNTYHNKFAVYSRWCDKIRERATRLGYIETFYGKRRKLDPSEVYTRGPNTIIQGSAAELMEVAMLECHRNIGDNGKVTVTVHDEVVIVAPKSKALIATKVLSDGMNNAMKIMFPNAASLQVAVAAYGTRWGDIKKEI